MTWLTTMKSHLTEIQLMLTPIQARNLSKVEYNLLHEGLIIFSFFSKRNFCGFANKIVRFWRWSSPCGEALALSTSHKLTCALTNSHPLLRPPLLFLLLLLPLLLPLPSLPPSLQKTLLWPRILPLASLVSPMANSLFSISSPFHPHPILPLSPNRISLNFRFWSRQDTRYPPIFRMVTRRHLNNSSKILICGSNICPVERLWSTTDVAFTVEESFFILFSFLDFGFT